MGKEHTAVVYTPFGGANEIQVALVAVEGMPEVAAGVDVELHEAHEEVVEAQEAVGEVEQGAAQE